MATSKTTAKWQVAGHHGVFSTGKVESHSLSNVQWRPRKWTMMTTAQPFLHRASHYAYQVRHWPICARQPSGGWQLLCWTSHIGASQRRVQVWSKQSQTWCEPPSISAEVIPPLISRNVALVLPYITTSEPGLTRTRPRSRRKSERGSNLPKSAWPEPTHTNGPAQEPWEDAQSESAAEQEDGAV